MKVIQFNTTSHSRMMKDYEKDIFKNWYAQLGFKIKEFYPEINVECWTTERLYEEQEEKERNNVKFRIFPTNLSLRHGMEISTLMLNTLKQEIRNAEKRNEKLVLHFHEYHSWQIYLILRFIKSKDIKIIAQHHGGRSPLKNLMKYKRLTFVLPVICLMQLCEMLLFKKINTFYGLSNEEINYLRKITPKSEVRFQTMGLSQDFLESKDKKQARKELKLDLNEKYILYLGRIKTTKGIKELLDSMKEFENTNIKLLLIGEGEDYEKYLKYSKEKDMKNVKFLGAIYGDKKLLYLSASNALILPSYTEGAPVVLMEAIAQNLPVIVTDVGGIRRMIKDKREGIIIKPKSKEEIITAIKDILKWENRDIRKYSRKYQWREIIKDTIQDYGYLK